MGHRIGKDRPRWGELLVTSNHTFLCGASHPEELVREAFRLGHDGMALTDLESFGGAVRAHAAAREVDTGRMPEAIEGGFRLAHGVRVRLAVDPSVALAMDEARSTPMSGSPLEIVLYASDRASWGALCRLLTTMRLPERVGMHGRPAAGARELLELLHAHPGGAGILGVLVPPTRPDHGFLAAAGMLACAMPERLWVAMRRTDDVESSIASERACHLAEALRVPVVACSDVRMHAASRRPLLDVLACIRQGVPIDRAGELVARHAERRLRRREEILVRYADRPDAVAAAWRVLERASAFSLDQLRYEYPDEVVPQGVTPSAHLRDLAWRGARERYPRGVPATVARQMEHEFEIIDDLSYAPYFLTVHDIVAFARRRGILCQGRGAAANSAVCYALGVTAVDPARIDVLFERFVSRERNEPPDIDIDFEHERREEVLQYVYGKYGRERAALVCEVVGYRGRSAVRDVAKALGFSPDTVSRLASSVDRWSGGGLGGRDDLAGVHADAPPVDALSAEAVARLREAGLDPSAPRSRLLVRLVGEILGFPRHRSQHVGGFVISRGPLCESVPIERAAMEGRSVLEWDKDDVEALGMLKIDLLSLGMLTAIRKSIALVNADRASLAAGAPVGRPPDAPAPRRDLAAVSPGAGPSPLAASGSPRSLGRGAEGTPAPSRGTAPATVHAPDAWPLRLHRIPSEDQATYDMICLADTVGVFQIESRAQMSMLPRLRPRTFYDLVVEVAIVRPGPIQGDMVHPYLRRRNGEEPVHYPDEAVRKVLAKTLGVPLFQEQAMALAVVAAGFTPGQADELRRAIAAWKRNGNRIAAFGESLMAGMAARGYGERFAHQVFEQIKGFAGYGFPESHAASFALLVYSSAWLKRHHPAAFAAALLNSQPMGFYAPAQILRDVGDHGVAVREVDVHASCWDCTLERGADLVAMLAARAAGASARERGRDLFGRPLAGDDGPAAVCSDTRTPSSSHPDHGRFVRIDACGGAPCIELREEHRRTFASSRLPTAGTPSVGSGNDADLRRWRTLGHPAEMDAAGAASVPRKTKDVETQHRPDVEGDAFRAAGPSGMSGHLPVDPFQPPGVSCTGHGRRDGATAAVRRAHARGRSVQRDGDRSDPSPEPLQAPSLTQVDADGRMHEPRRTDDRTDGRDSPARDFAVPTQPALRLGLRMVRGLAFEEAERVVAAVRRHGTFERMRDLFDASGVRVATLRRLAAADAFRSMGLDRQQATWQILALRDRERPLWSFGPSEDCKSEACTSEACTSESEALQVPTQSGDGLQAAMAGEGLPPSRAVIPTQDEHEPNLPRVSRLAAITRDLESTGVSTRGHPIECIRPRLQRARAIPCGFLREPDRTPAGRRVVVAGLVLVRQRPSTAKGVVFMTIEDGSGIANLVYRPRIYERLRKTVRQAQALLVRGMVERRDGVVHVLVDAAKSLAGAWDDPASAPPVHARDFH